MILGNPAGEWSFSELAHAVDSSIPTVGREVDRAAQAGIVKVRDAGRTRLVSANTTSEYFEPLLRLLVLGFGPKRRLAEKLSGMPGVEEAYLFGSWAERYLGTEGRAPRDIDLLVIGTPDRSDVYTAIEGLESELGRPIQVTFRTMEQWRDRSDPFVATVRSRALVPLLGEARE
jgi:predicted nucleotidyltransferase